MEMYLIMITVFILALVLSNTVVLIHEEDGTVSSFFSKQLTDTRWFISSLIIVTTTAVSLSDQPVEFYVVGVLLSIVVIYDLKYFLAPNFMSAIICITGVAHQIIENKHLSFLSEGIVSSMVIFLVWVITYYFFKGGIGGGDFKLLMALSFTLGSDFTFLMVFIAVFSVIALTPFFLLITKKLNEIAIPLVPFILFGYIITVKFGDSIITWYRGG